MAYTKTVWNNDAAPAINAANLNKIENGIFDAFGTPSTEDVELGYTTLGDIRIVWGIREVSVPANSYNQVTVNWNGTLTKLLGYSAILETTNTAGALKLTTPTYSDKQATFRVASSLGTAASPKVHYIAIGLK